MSIPTRFIEHEEFDELVRQEEGDTIMKWQLEAFDFHPPRPEGNEVYPDPSAIHLHLLFLNVFEPRLYRDRSGEMFVVLSSVGTYEYDDWRDIHPNKDAWGYVLAPHGWDSTDWNHDLDDAEWFFVEEKLGLLDREDVLTH